jgi:hypothetical protein
VPEVRHDPDGGHLRAPAPRPAAADPRPATVPVPAATAATSVRPPDLEPDAVRDHPDPLAGWDADVPAGTAVVRDQAPFPTDTVVVLGAGIVGLLFGAFASGRRGRGATYGALGGILGAAIVRRIWRLP